jgi:hypothetical protein
MPRLHDAPNGRSAQVAASVAGSHLRFGWLFSWRADLGMLLVPALVTAASFALAMHAGDFTAKPPQAVYGGWIAAYVLGNTSHVLLTYLLLGARRDVLHATARQARTVIVGSLLVFAASLVITRLTRDDPFTYPFWLAVTMVFATHHTLAQVKGFWALYGLRGGQIGLPPPLPRERELQQLFVPLGVLFIAVKWTLVGRDPGPDVTPYTNVNPGDPALLPFWVTYALVAAWLAYAGVVFRSLLAPSALNLAKLVYLGTQFGVVLLSIMAPVWGVMLSAGIHGLEYYLLTRKMLAPTPDEASSRLTAALCWPAIVAAMAPILVVGALQNPWLPIDLVSPGVRTWSIAVVNGVVLAHYCADAFIYRFRIPGVRKVAMARLGF